MENKDTITAGKRFTVYGLVNTRTKSIRKIGMTGDPKERARKHKKAYPTLELQVIGECESHNEMALWEFLFIEFWQPPLNEIPGGGVSPMSCPKVRAKVAGRRHHMFGKKHSEKTRAKMSAARKKCYAENPYDNPMLGKKHSEEARAKMRAAKRAPEVRAKISAAHKKRCEDPTERALMSARMKKYLEDPAMRMKLSARMKKAWADRAHEDRVSLSMRMSAAQKKRFEENPDSNWMLGKKHSEETRAKMREARKRYLARRKAAEIVV